MKMNKKHGFTLIELMIVVAIIGILALIAIPYFQGFVLKSKTAEAKTNIGGIRTSMEAFRAERDFYPILQAAPAGAVLGPTKQAWVQQPCTACVASNPNCNSFDCIGYRPSGAVYYQYDTNALVGANIPEFAIGARGDLDGDGAFGLFYMQSTNNPVPSALIGTNSVNTCATFDPATPQGGVIDCLPGTY